MPLDETIEILVEKAFTNNWFNETHSMDISKSDLIELLKEATKDQLFQFDVELSVQIDGVGWAHMWALSWPMFSCAA